MRVVRMLVAVAALAGPLPALGSDADVAVQLASATTTVGKPDRLEIRFRVAPGSHISPEAPLSIRVTAPKDVSVERTVLHYVDAVEKGVAPRFEDAVTASAPGDHALEVAMSYYVCKAELCDRRTKSEKLILRVR
ncbi:MAG: hypothetical protein ACYCWW_06500 [Deltaproteobacteria bacterium]